jgi:hypothetical protein
LVQSTRICDTGTNRCLTINMGDLTMPELFSGAFARVRAAVHAFIDDPFDVLHRHYWSAPWLEAKLQRQCGERCG